eukprot:TRINITY_DN3354_c0_g1_i5.p1 TRINITY_DN3354_c0_g1~~TRINITY_DN3354_c0_g1_i5.p1  ORF type:complete len:714 (-),score=76.71 TRINITY_DN3354_c0_g1_i5:337-2478(-)
MATSGIPSRITHHTLVAVMLMSCGVLAPVLLLMKSTFGDAALIIGTGLLAAGCSSIVGAAFSRCFDRSVCSALRWRLIIVSPWLLNPVLVAIAALQCDCTIKFAAWWSGVPLAVAVSVLSMGLLDGDIDLQQGACPPRISFLGHWLLSRLTFIGFPFCLFSLQVALYLPLRHVRPQGAEIGFCLCGICFLVGAKFCAVCACLAHERCAPGVVVVLFLAGDWTSSLNLFGIVTDEGKTDSLLLFLALAGIMQLRTALARLSLRSRWSRFFASQRSGVRDVLVISSGTGADMELGAHINAVVNREVGSQIETSDSDDEHGPGSVPDGFYEALVCVLGIPPPRAEGARRQFLCGLRNAVVSDGLNPGGGQAQAASFEGSDAVVSTPKQLAEVTSSIAVAPVVPPSGDSSHPPIHIQTDDRVCTVCQEEIRTGDLIRPLPKCPHIFHADCLEGWAKTMREATRCPTCRRPALARRAEEGAVSFQVLTACGDVSDSSFAPSRSRSISASSSYSSTMTSRNSGSDGESRSVSIAHRGRVFRTVEGGRQDGEGLRGLDVSRQPVSSLAGQQTRSQDFTRSPAVAALTASLAVSELMAIAALQYSGGAPDVAAHVLLEHRGVLQSTYGPSSRVSVAHVPDGVAEAFVSSNSDLAACQTALQSQLGALYQSGILPVTPWAELTSSERVHVFQFALEDVARKLNSRILAAEAPAFRAVQAYAF